MANTSLLPKSWEIPKIFRDRLGSQPGKQRAMFEEGHLLLVLHAPPKADEDTREGRFFWRDSAGKWRSTLGGAGIGAMQQHLKDYRDALEAIEHEEESANTAKDYFHVLCDLTPLRRSSRNLHQALQAAREMAPSDQALIDLRDEAYALERESELLYGDTKNGLDYYSAKKEEEQAEQGHRMLKSGHRLNVLAAIFLPLMTLTSLLGMNIRHGLETATPPYTFLAILAVGLALGFMLKSKFFGE